LRPSVNTWLLPVFALHRQGGVSSPSAPLPSAAMDDQQGDRDEEDSHSDRVEHGQGRTVDSSSPAIAVVSRAACAGGCTLP
jgi:hypothetical protein